MKGKTLILYPESSRGLAIQMAMEHRSHKMDVQCMRMEDGKTFTDYIAYGKHHQFSDLVYPMTEDNIQVMNLFTDEMKMTNLKNFR